jgi:hypothetical protein
MSMQVQLHVDAGAIHGQYQSNCELKVQNDLLVSDWMIARAVVWLDSARACSGRLFERGREGAVVVGGPA